MTMLFQFVLVPEPIKNIDDPQIMHVMLDPLVTAMRQERYAFMKDLHVWNLSLQHDQISSLVSSLSHKCLEFFANLKLSNCLILMKER